MDIEERPERDRSRDNASGEGGPSRPEKPNEGIAPINHERMASRDLEGGDGSCLHVVKSDRPGVEGGYDRLKAYIRLMLVELRKII